MKISHSVLNVISVSALSLIPLLLGCPGRNSGGTAASATYEEKCSAFTIGTIALQTGDRSGRAEKELKRFTEIAPEEPAGWANLALVDLPNRLPEATTEINKANSLAANVPGIEAILSLIADRQGDLKAAIDHASKAVQLDPTNLRIRYSYAKELLRNNTPESDAAYQGEIQKIVNLAPTNIVALINLATISSKRGDKVGLSKSVSLIKQLSGGFSPEQKKCFDTLEADSKSENISGAVVNSRFFENRAKELPIYPISFVHLMLDPKAGLGDPLEQFIKLPQMIPTPDVIDGETHFTMSPSGAKTAWTCALTLDHTGKQVIATADSKSVHLSDTVNLPFPGGGKAPGSNGVLAFDSRYTLRSDLLFAGEGGVKLYVQDEKGSFSDATAAMKIPTAVTSGKFTAAWAVDIESDGDLDVLLGSQAGPPVVLRNNGDGSFAAISPFSTISGATAFVAIDTNGDGNPDAAIVDGKGKLHVFMNQRSGVYVERSVPTTISEVRGITAGDLQAEGVLSLIFIDSTGSINRLVSTKQGTDWEITTLVKSHLALTDPKSTACLFVVDLDNNGAIDLVASSGNRSEAWLAGPDYKLTALASVLPGMVTSLATPLTGGRPDLIGISADGTSVRMVNAGIKNYNWQDVRPRAADVEFFKKKGDKRSNTYGVGGEIEARAAGLYEKLLMDGPTIHVGLGHHLALDAIRILWPTGDIKSHFSDVLKSNQSCELIHQLDSSCPFLFTWNGKEMQFVTDCIWRSPLGLKINAQDTAGVAMTQDWVKIRGDQLVPNAEGKLDLRITAELWETHFFDHLSLLTVDHPTGTDVFVDERFAIPAPPLKVNLTTVLQPIVKATDDNGTDVSETVKSRDNVYLDTFGRGEYQGVTRDHWVEVEVPSTKAAQQWLVCSGFIHPTNSSINVALGQGHGSPPQGLTIETPDDAGKWTTVRPGYGFPEGKVKTILIDLTGLFKPGAAHRLRLRTNLEIYWDAIQVADGLPADRMKTSHLFTTAADLQYRGFSKITAANPSSPELPESYEKLDAVGQKWRDLEGYCTRYGDVQELLRSIDDRYVFMNAGDELRFKFDAPPPPQSGYTRDYVLIGDGWVKDGNYNTTFSKTVLPLPEHGTASYSKAPRFLEDDPVYKKHAKDWEVYHTRYVWPANIGSRLAHRQ